MKKLFLIFAAAIFALGVSAQDKSGLKFVDAKTVAEAQSIAQKEGKVLMLDVYATWCGPCKRLAAVVFPSPDVESLNSKIVAFQLNAEEGEGVTYARNLKVTAYPSLIFFKNGKEVARMVGAPSTPADFVKAVNDKLADVK